MRRGVRYRLARACRRWPGALAAAALASGLCLAPPEGLAAEGQPPAASASAFASVSTSASASAWARQAQVAVRLIAASPAVGAGESVTLGLDIRLDPGWKIYWRTPGDAGVAPRFDWRGSDNLAGAQVRWPLPRRFTLYGLETYGYLGEVVLPIRATLAKPGAPLHLALSVAYGICREICIPYTAKLRLDLPQGPAASGRFAPLIAGFAAKVPLPGPQPALGIERARLARRDGHLFLDVAARAAAPFQATDLLVEGASGVGFGPPETRLTKAGHRAVLRLPVTGADGASLGGRRLTLTLVDGTRAIEQTVEIGSAR